ncbi:MAG: hypothetical protein B0D96_09370 [Candidatus Sedimenticola endophacoides]|uniref:Efflux RND transporter periplasmic adaptor subunit n=2 Tax=Candidatus Sedimenticola endophacoides TaxID=2548426 RepID=A0A6N4E5V1_9GAMM|nr:MAG: hypothetical protein B0D94_02450 [Candidatus Sedimenticola endophacoides]OQX34427.1 MAG: hypothetical protein B0D96_09370 [Candidatus Sedimenticola endophacoides]OQX41942.1 MAG: hypothetical protein B0D89_02535 [Candidatus Sedimenticola endophacoides]OQX43425.1 MAG: hypothetical protein B0D86_07535 [Candidatus Sedimenticola endophacoides]PUD99659.1 MAG: efflux RND transporter periplasmic adaptor subunit [Candidatus Sedimenticola endophacoides]
MSTSRKRWVLLIPVVIGVALFAMMKKNRLEPVQEPPGEQAKAVRVVTVPSLTVLPRATGHGSVRPSRTWEAVAQVRGKIVERHPGLEKGAIVESGTLVLRIDPADYELAIAQADADIQAAQAQLRELEANATNIRASLGIEQEALALNRKELQRKRDLLGKGGVSRSDLDNQERSLLAQQQSVQAQRNALNLLPSQRALLEAQLARHQAALAVARRNLEHTAIRLPFTGRISEVRVEQAQYVREGEALFGVDDLQRAEIEAQIPIDQMAPLFHASRPIDILNRPDAAAAFGQQITARVRLRENGLSAEWEGRFARLSDSLDPKTRTAGVIVEVDDPYAGMQPGVRPPLVKGLFVQIDLTGTPRPDRIAIPRSALRSDQRVYIANADNRLEIRPVETGLIQPEYVVLSQGVNAGERLVVSDLVPAIDGMLLAPHEDPETLARLSAGATGGTAR